MSNTQPSMRDSIGVSRNLTYEFKKMRKENPVKKSRFQLSPSHAASNGSEKLLENIEIAEFSKHCLPPLWVDIYDQILDDLKKLEDSVPILEKAQRQRLAITFGNTKPKDSEIRNHGDSISQLIRSVGQQLKELENHPGSDEDKLLRRNIAITLKQKLQAHTFKYKKLQTEYVNKLKNTEPGDLMSNYHEDEIEGDETADQDLMHMNVAAERNEAIVDLVTNIQELADIFKELSSLVLNQGTILDRIDYNIEMTLEHTKKANQELIKAEKHQRCTRATGCIMFLVIMIVLMIVTLGLKHLI